MQIEKKKCNWKNAKPRKEEMQLEEKMQFEK